MAQFLNQKSEDLTGQIGFKFFLDQINYNLFTDCVKVVETGENLETDFDYYYQKKHRWYNLIAVKLDDGFSITIRDITERKKLEIELKHLASLDGLTGVANRRIFDETLAREWKQCQREMKPLALILCDVDCFKNYNDYYQHQAGDDCLIKVAKTLNKFIKRPTDLLARYGGEEFVIILPNTDLKGAVKIAELMRTEIKILKIPHAKSEVNNYVTLSFGIASIIPNQKLSLELLIKSADQALFKAKIQGRDRIITMILN